MKWHDQQDRLRHVKWDYRSMPDWAYFVIVLALMVAITVNYVYLGRKEPYVAELFILPVMVAAFRYKILGGFLCGVATALFAGPIAFELMQPHWVAPGAPQYEDWLFLLVYSSVMGIVIGLFVQLQQRHKDEALRLQCQDPVTGLANLEGLRKIMSELLSDTSQPVRSFSKYAIRINNYQSLINAFGYRFADEFIRRFSDHIKAHFPHPNILARVSPSTLAVVNEGKPDTHITTCQKLLDLQQTHSVYIDNIPVHPELSIGVAWSKMDRHDIDHLFSNAELAATQARYDPERIIQYSSSTRIGQRERIHLLGSFSESIKKGHIRLEYQPKLDLSTRRIVSVEALARWADPEQGAIPPSKFIPLLEETRIINTLTSWIMREAVRQMRAWRDQGLDIGVSINVSARNFDVAGTFSGLEDLLRQYAVEGSRLEMEITETSFIHLTERKLHTIASIRDLGVRMAIDDFGTGYASLSYLRQLPIDVVKLDSTFVNQGLEHPHDLLMVKRMVDIAKDRDLLVVAEGVETESQLKAMEGIGVDQIQGYYLSRPLPPDELLALVVQRDKSDPRDAKA